MRSPRAFRPHDERRPKILVADDNASILEKAAALLARDFDLVAAVTDGQQALDASLRLDPDVAILDVSMPVLDGFQTARALKRAGSRAKIVTLTMHQSDDYVAAAIESGAHGFVMKTRMHSDLASAIEHAIDGRLFLPSPASLLAITPPGAGTHAVQFRFNDRTFLSELSRMFSIAFQRGDVTAIVATESTRAGIEQRLVADGWDIALATARGTHISLDAATVLSQLIVDGRLDTGRLAAAIDDLERARVATSASQLTIVGEMAALLCRDGNPEAAIHLEQAWEDLTRSLPFVTVCTCPMECFTGTSVPEIFPLICAAHRSICHAHGA